MSVGIVLREAQGEIWQKYLLNFPFENKYKRKSKPQKTRLYHEILCLAIVELLAFLASIVPPESLVPNLPPRIVRV